MIDIIKFIFSILVSVGVNYAIFSSINGKEKNVWEISQSQVVPQQISLMLLENMTVKVEEAPKEVKKEKPKEVNKAKVPVKKKIEKQEEKKVEKKVAQNITPPPVKPPPKIISKAKVKNTPPPLYYPDDAFNKNHYGNVIIKCTIDENGSFTSIEVIKSSGYLSLDDAAVKWFREIEFHPANNSDGAVSSTVTQTITFTLKN